MEIKNGKIVSATNVELYEYWLKQWSDIYSYTEYKNKVKELGTEDDRVCGYQKRQSPVIF